VNTEPIARVPSEHVGESSQGTQATPVATGNELGEPVQESYDHRVDGQSSSNGTGTPNKDAGERKPARGLEPFEAWEREEMEQLLSELRGHLGKIYWTKAVLPADHGLPVIYPTRFLEGEDVANNFLFPADR
jgi:phospholipase D1/2